MAGKDFLDVPFEVKADEVEESGIFKGYGSTFGGKPDVHGDIVVQGAFSNTLAAGGRNGTGIAMLWVHRSDEPIGNWLELAEDKKGLRVVGQLIREVPTGDKAYHLLKKGAIKGLSIGYDTVIHEFDDKKKLRYLKEIDLWEISLVTFPANTRATVTVVKMLEEAKTVREIEDALRESGHSKGEAQQMISVLKASLRDSGMVMGESGLSVILDSLKDVNEDLRIFGQSYEEKGVIPFKSYPKAPEGEAWDAGAQVKAASVKDMKQISTWFNDANPDVKGSYKLPHHKVKGYKTVWRGVANAMARLLQPATKIPKDDKKGCHSHLMKHYKEFNKPAPEFRDYNDEEWTELFPDDLAGILLEEGMSGILDSLTEINN